MPGNPGRLDWVILFYYPSTSKNSIGETVTSMNATSRKIRAERMFKSSNEAIDAMQQVGSTMASFRMVDVRNSGFSISQTWEFDAYQISNASDVKRYKVRGIEVVGRKDTIVVTGETRDNK